MRTPNRSHCNDQLRFDVRCEWGLPGIRLVGASADVLIIVDVLSFSTCVEVAVSRGARVFPYRWKDETAREYATQVGAELAVQRGQTGRFSLSPVSMQTSICIHCLTWIGLGLEQPGAT